MRDNTRVSIVIPCLNEGSVIGQMLDGLQPLRQQGHELILVDGGSTDDTSVQAQRRVDRLVRSPRGRARQLNAGAKVAAGGIFWFLHADSQVPTGGVDAIVSALASDNRYWGRFDVVLTGRHRLLRLVEFMMNWRSRLTGIATGDQGIFMRREAFTAVGGFPEIPLMEDIEISRRLKRLSPPCCLPHRLGVSSRRWERQGILRTIWLMWRLRFAYALGADPADLARRYLHCSSPTPES
jgi:rSAM/selenodomain-associated transferase 2